MDLIPPGRYRAKCIDAQLGETKKGGEQVGMGFEILDGEYQGRVQFGFFYFTDKSAEYTLEKMRNAGWQGDDLLDLSSLCPSDVECSIVVEHEDYTNDEGETKTTAKIAFVNKPFDGKVKMAAPLDDAKKRQFAARMKGAAVASRQGQTSSKPATKPANGARKPDPHPFAPGNAPDDDLPF